MCGRLSTANLLAEDLAGLFQLNTIPDYLQSYNIAPSLQIPAIREEHQLRSLANLKWGLIPHWTRDKNLKASTFNARVETLTQKPFFRDSFKTRRCIIPVTGFYEWQKQGEKKQPYYIFRADQQPLALAGLWDRWTDKLSGETIESCTIVTVPALHRMAEIHERMPAILEAEFFATWLDPGFKETHVLQDIIRLPQDVVTMYPVSSYVNNARHAGEKCIERL